MREKSHLKNQILDEAARLFVERGYHAVSMREISETLNVSKSALYITSKTRIAAHGNPDRLLDEIRHPS